MNRAGRLPPVTEIVTDRNHPDLANALPIGSHAIIHPPLVRRAGHVRAYTGHTYRALITGYHDPALYKDRRVRYIIDYDDPVNNDKPLLSRVYVEDYVQAEQYEIEELPV